MRHQDVLAKLAGQTARLVPPTRGLANSNSRQDRR